MRHISTVGPRDYNDDKGLSREEIAGISAGSAVFVLIIIGVAWWATWRRRWKKKIEELKREAEESVAKSEEENGQSSADEAVPAV
jgi:hypothetical protein